VKKSKFTEQQIAFALKQGELGTAVEEVRRKIGIRDATFYNQERKFDGLEPVELRRCVTGWKVTLAYPAVQQKSANTSPTIFPSISIFESEFLWSLCSGLQYWGDQP
jgi:hypothetical protein